MSTQAAGRKTDTRARAAALDAYRLAGTPPEAAFDDLAGLAARLCGAPAAGISLLGEDRQWFKAQVGFTLPESPLTWSVCLHTVDQGDGLMVIEDLAADVRTARNPIVTGPGVRFYAGAPLLTPEGVAIGALCVMDFSPRPGGLDVAQGQGLAILARAVMAEMETRRALLAAQLETARWRLVEEEGAVGAFTLDTLTGKTAVSPVFCRLFGLEPRDTYPVEALERLILEEPGTGGRSNAASRLAGDGPLDAEYRIRRADDGAVRWIRRRAEFARDDQGRAVAMYGAMRDVTVQRQGEVRVEALLSVGERLRDCADPVEVGYLAAEALGRTLGAGSAAFASVSRDGQTLKVERAWAAPGVQRLEGEFHMPDFGVFYEEISRGEMLVVHDAANDPRATKGPDGLARAGAQAFISLPIMEYGRFVAMISVNASGPRMWDEGETGFARAVADLAYSARARALAEAEQKVVNQEIGHRLKNSLVMVQSIARQTLGAAAPGPLAAFEQRLQALSAAHDLLFRDEWDSADMAAVAARTLHAVALAERFEITGPPVWLGAKATLSLSLVLHEMATNAAKYGALSNAAGKVVVDWTVEGQDLSFRWREVGGPTVTPPDKTGFGSRLIQLGLAGGGQATLRYPETGFEAELSAPLERLRGA